MEQATELKELYLRCCKAMSAGDGAFFERHFSQQDGVLAIGTDPAEWWTGHATISGVFKAQLQETGGFKLLPGTAQAFRDGSTGWVAGQPTLTLPDNSQIPLRLTAVFHEEPGGWKIVQWHFSAGVPNKALTGDSLTTE